MFYHKTESPKFPFLATELMVSMMMMKQNCFSSPETSASGNLYASRELPQLLVAVSEAKLDAASSLLAANNNIYLTTNPILHVDFH